MSTRVLAALMALLATAAPAGAAGAKHRPVVVGIVLPAARPAFAAIRSTATAKAKFYRVGQRVDDALVTKILADRVILTSGDERTELRLAGATTAPAASAPAAAPAPRLQPARQPASRGGAPSASPYGRVVALAPIGAAGATTERRVDASGATLIGSGAIGTGASAATAEPAGVSSPVDGEPTTAPAEAEGEAGASLVITGRLHDGGSRQAETFTAASLRDLLVSTTSSTAAQRQRIELYAPDGALYQRISGAAAPSTQTLIPVGGTWITEHALFGTWRVDLYVDRDTTPAVSRTFTLTP